MRRLLLVGLSALMLTGCITEQPATGAAAAKLAETCKSYGFKPGTDQFAVCVFQLDQNRMASNRQRRMAIGAAMAGTGAQMQANAARQSALATASRPTTCRSVAAAGGVVNTTCY